MNALNTTLLASLPICINEILDLGGDNVQRNITAYSSLISLSVLAGEDALSKENVSGSERAMDLSYRWLLKLITPETAPKLKVLRMMVDIFEEVIINGQN